MRVMLRSHRLGGRRVEEFVGDGSDSLRDDGRTAGLAAADDVRAATVRAVGVVVVVVMVLLVSMIC
jgi:hypothetical protein